MLAYSTIGDSSAARLLGHTPVRFRQRALHGFGDAYSDCIIACPDDDDACLNACSSTPADPAIAACNANPATFWNSQTGTCQIVSGSTSSGGGSSSSSSSNGSSGWAQALTAFTTGVTKGILSPTTPATTLVVAPPPWYTQWWGIGAILVTGVGAFMLLKPPPARTTGISGARKRRK